MEKRFQERQNENRLLPKQIEGAKRQYHWSVEHCETWFGGRLKFRFGSICGGPSTLVVSLFLFAIRGLRDSANVHAECDRGKKENDVGV